MPTLFPRRSSGHRTSPQVPEKGDSSWIPGLIAPGRRAGSATVTQPTDRENTCPRWDSNRAPPLENPPLPRKPPQSGQVRSPYNRIRSAGCVHIVHTLFLPSYYWRTRSLPRPVEAWTIPLHALRQSALHPCFPAQPESDERHWLSISCAEQTDGWDSASVIAFGPPSNISWAGQRKRA
jgi:hypothetical protein